MENLNNYQEVINALKAKYVDARNLKRQAKAKLREVNSSNSFLSRKNIEKGVLDDKLTINRDAVESIIPNSAINIENGKFNIYKLQLSDLKSDLASINAQLEKLDKWHDEVDSEEYPDRTSTESQTLNLVRGMINDAISAAESTFNDAYNNSAYQNIKDEVRPQTNKSTHQEIINHYYNLEGKFNQVVEETNVVISEFVEDYYTKSWNARSLRDEIYAGVIWIEALQSELALLIGSNTPQSNIDSKELEIENEKAILVERSKDLKKVTYELKSLSDFFEAKTVSYFDSLYGIKTEMEEFYIPNFKMLMRTFKRPSDYTQTKVLGFTDLLMEKLSQTFGSVSTPAGSFNLFTELQNDFMECGDTWTWSNKDLESSSIFNELVDNYSQGMFQLVDGKLNFKPDMSEDIKEDVINYYSQLNAVFEPYMRLKADMVEHENRYNTHFGKLEELSDNHIEFTNVYIKAMTDEHWASRVLAENLNGSYNGTNEQLQELSDAFQDKIQKEADYTMSEELYKLATLRYVRYESIFTEFYSTLQQLESARLVAEGDFNSAENNRLNLLTIVNEAYDLLQSLSAAETAYLQALYNYEKNANEVQLATNGNNLLVAVATQASEFLQTTLAGEAEYQQASLGGSIDPTLDYGTGFNSFVLTTELQSDGKLFVGGGFTAYDGSTGNRIIRLNSDGSKDTTFDIGTGFDNTVFEFDVQSDGKLLVGGLFNSYKGVSSSKIIRLNSDGSKDTTFNIGTGFNLIVREISSYSDKILVSGDFTSYKGATANRIILLNSDGSKDTTFDSGTGFNNPVYSTILQSDGKILVGGFFTSYNGATANRIVRLNTDGSVDATFDVGTGFSGQVNAIKLQSDGKILVGGSFNSYNGSTGNKIIRLNTDGSIDDTFDYGTGFNGDINSISLISGGKILVGGTFTSYNGTSVGKFICLNSDGSVDDTFEFAGGFNDTVYSITVKSPNSEIYVGGGFTDYQGIFANRIVQIKPYGVIIPQSENDRLTTLHYVYLGATADYATKAAAVVDDYAINIAPFIVLRDEAYTALMDLADEDAAYQAALTNWNDNQANLNTFTTMVYDPAVIAKSNAEYNKQMHINQTVYFYGIGVGGSTLFNIFNIYNELYNEHQLGTKLSLFQQANDNYFQIRSNMTFVESTQEQKLEARRSHAPEQYKRYMNKNNWYNKVTKHIDYIESFNVWFQETVEFLKQNHQDELDSYLLSSTSFLESMSENKKFRHLMYVNMNFRMHIEAVKLRNFNYSLINSMDGYFSFMNEFRPGMDAVGFLRQNSTEFAEKIKLSLDDSITRGALSGLAYYAINWTENGGEFQG